MINCIYIKANSGCYNIEETGMNSKFSDYGSAYLGDKQVFAPARDTGGTSKKYSNGTTRVLPFYTNRKYTRAGAWASRSVLARESIQNTTNRPSVYQ